MSSRGRPSELSLFSAYLPTLSQESPKTEEPSVYFLHPSFLSALLFPLSLFYSTEDETNEPNFARELE